MIDFKDKVMGVIFGTAIGDALGAPVEFNTAVTPENPQVFPSSVPEQYTDDTQMFRAVCEGLLQWASDGPQREGRKAIDDAAEWIGDEFVKWAQSPENNRAPGASCMAACRSLEDGETPWDLCGVDSGGCGTAMRSMAYGIWFYENAERAAEWAECHSALTHTHSIAGAAAAAVAAGVSVAMHLDPDEVLDAKKVAEVMVSAAIDIDLKTGAMLGTAMETKDSAVIILDEWRGWAGHEAVAASLWCFLQHPDDYEEAVLLAVNSPGDSDSLGAITGALVGANVGLSGIPEHWVAQVEDSAGLRELGERICECLGV